MGIAVAGSKARLEAVIAQQPQHIFGDAGRGVTDEADSAGAQIRQATDRIVDRAVGIEKHRVDCEVAPCRIGGPIGVKGDAGAATIGLDIAP